MKAKNLRNVEARSPINLKLCKNNESMKHSRSNESHGRSLKLKCYIKSVAFIHGHRVHGVEFEYRIAVNQHSSIWKRVALHDCPENCCGCEK
jgi:hypothetical protein